MTNFAEQLAGAAAEDAERPVEELPKGPTGKILKREIEVPETVAAQSG